MDVTDSTAQDRCLKCCPPNLTIEVDKDANRTVPKSCKNMHDLMSFLVAHEEMDGTKNPFR